MADAKPFSFKELFAKNAPEGRDAPVVKRGKYDFAVAYPDPKVHAARRACGSPERGTQRKRAMTSRYTRTRAATRPCASSSRTSSRATAASTSALTTL